MKYLSLFSGIGGFELGIHDAFPDAQCVGFSEIDKYAIKVYQSNFPEHKNYGDIKDIDISSLPDFDMLVGGFPCQDLSIAKVNRKGLDGERSGLFWTMLSILRLKNPKYFCFENVASMPKRDRDIITNELGVEPIMINTALVSAQSRKRLFWCNWDVRQPEDRNILLKGILESGEELKIGERKRGKAYCLDANYWKNENLKHHLSHHLRQLIVDDPQTVMLYHLEHGYKKRKLEELPDKYPTLHANSPGSNHMLLQKKILRKLYVVECERLQCFPDGWTEGVSNTQRYKQLGNAVNVEVVKHIMNELRRSQ